MGLLLLSAFRWLRLQFVLLKFLCSRSKEPRGARRWHARLRVAPLYSVGPVLGPDHEAIIRFGGKAPRRRAHSNERFDDHVQARVTTTSDRDRPTRQEVSAWRAETCVAGLVICEAIRRLAAAQRHAGLHRW